MGLGPYAKVKKKNPNPLVSSIRLSLLGLGPHAKVKKKNPNAPVSSIRLSLLGLGPYAKVKKRKTLMCGKKVKKGKP